MNKFYKHILISLRSRIAPRFGSIYLPELTYKDDSEECNRIILTALLSNKPFMVARYGSTEMRAISNYIGIRDSSKSVIDYIYGRTNQWWWNGNFVNDLMSNAGFFPLNKNNIVKFCDVLIRDAKEIDLLGSWVEEEFYLRKELINAQKFWIGNLEPPYLNSHSSYNWLQALKGKKVLVVHPFADTIRKQYDNNRTKLYKNPDFVPEFDLITLKAVQSIGGNSQFADWFEALEWMENEMDKINYEICIIGCGAYGLPLAAHAKRTGHKAIHLGGATQLLFGIKGKRWEEKDSFKSIFNEYWVRPSENEKPKTADKVEGGCYW